MFSWVREAGQKKKKKAYSAPIVLTKYMENQTIVLSSAGISALADPFGALTLCPCPWHLRLDFQLQCLCLRCLLAARVCSVASMGVGKQQRAAPNQMAGPFAPWPLGGIIQVSVLNQLPIPRWIKLQLLKVMSGLKTCPCKCCLLFPAHFPTPWSGVSSPSKLTTSTQILDSGSYLGGLRKPIHFWFPVETKSKELHISILSKMLRASWLGHSITISQENELRFWGSKQN